MGLIQTIGLHDGVKWRAIFPSHLNDARYICWGNDGFLHEIDCIYRITSLLGSGLSNTSHLPKPFPIFCATQKEVHKLSKSWWVNLIFCASS
jgi:hypothetical protein